MGLFNSSNDLLYCKYHYSNSVRLEYLFSLCIMYKFMIAIISTKRKFVLRNLSYSACAVRVMDCVMPRACAVRWSAVRGKIPGSLPHFCTSSIKQERSAKSYKSRDDNSTRRLLTTARSISYSDNQGQS